MFWKQGSFEAENLSQCVAPFVEHVEFLSDKIVLKTGGNVLKDQVISVILGNIILTWIILIMRLLFNWIAQTIKHLNKPEELKNNSYCMTKK